MPQVDPCMFPGTRREWNADAAAAKAKKEFEEKAVELGDDPTVTLGTLGHRHRCLGKAEVIQVGI